MTSSPECLEPRAVIGGRCGWCGLAIALALALVCEVSVISRSPTISADGTLFISIARSLPSGAAQSFRENDQHPGYPALILGVSSVAQLCGAPDARITWILSAQAVSAAFGLLSIVAVWLFARSLFGLHVANLSGVLLAILPLLRRNASDALSDTPHLTFYLLAVWMAFQAIGTRRPRWFAASGILAGLAFWIRPEGLEVMVIAPTVYTLQLVSRRITRREWCLGLGCMGAACMAVVMPYLLLAGKVTSKQIPFAKKEPVPVFAVQQAQAAHANAAEQQAPSRAGKQIKVILKLLAGATNEWAKSMAQGFKFVLIPLYFLGQIEMYRRWPNWWQILLIAGCGVLHIALLFGVYFISGYVDHRHVVPLVGLATPFAALGAVYVARWMEWGLQRCFSAQVSHQLLANALVCACCLTLLPWTLRRLNPEFQPVLEAVKWVDLHSSSGDVVLSNSPYAPFYAQRQVALLKASDAKISDLMRNPAVKTACNYAVIHINAHEYDPQWMRELGPEYKVIFELEDPRPGHPTRVAVCERHTAVAARWSRPAIRSSSTAQPSLH